MSRSIQHPCMERAHKHCHVIMIHCRRWFDLSVHRTIDIMTRLHILSFNVAALPVRNIKGIMVASDVQKGLFRQPCGLLEAFQDVSVVLL